MKLFTLLGLLIMATMGHSQYYYLEYSGNTPGGLNQDPAYPEGSGQVSGWTEIVGPSVATPAWSTQQSIPFSFNFNGAAVTNYYASSTGVLTFNATPGTAPSATPAALPSASIPDNSVCVWGMNASGTNDYVSVKTFGTAPNRQLWVHWGSCVNGTHSWSYWSIVLEETTNNIYLVEQRNSASGNGALSCGIQINGSTAYAVAGSPSVGSNAGSSAESDDDYYYQFIYGTQPANEIELLSVDTDPVIVAGNYTIQGTIKNLGSSTMTQFDVDWNDGTSHNQTITGVNIASGAEYQFSHPTPLAAVAGQTYTVDVCATVTGDVNANNNCIDNTTLVTASQTGTRLTLLELFTSSTCPPCYTLNYVTFDGNGLNDYLASENANDVNNAGIAVVKHQVDWPGAGDHAWNNDVDTRTSYYGITGAPTPVTDGTQYDNTTYNSSDVNYHKAQPAFMDITGTYSMNGTTITVDVEVDPYMNVSSGKLFIALCDKYYAAGGSGDNFTNGETEYHHVLRKLIPSASGKTVNLTVGNQYTTQETYNYSVHSGGGFPAQGSFDLHEGAEQEVVIYVQAQDGTILNAAIASVANVGIEDNKKDHQVMVFPNPTDDIANIAVKLDQTSDVQINVVNTLGQTVYANQLGQVNGFQNVQLDTDKLDAGIYMINININGDIVTKKLNVVK